MRGLPGTELKFCLFLYGCKNKSLTLRQKRRLKVFEYRELRRIFVSKKDDMTRKWTNYIMRKMEEMSEYNVYNTVKTKTKTHLKCTNTQALTLKKNNNFLLGKINTKISRQMPCTLKNIGYSSYSYTFSVV